MGSTDFELVIVGAGPIGSNVAKIVAREEYSVFLIEEHKTIGTPVQCAGLVSERVLDFTTKKNYILNEICGGNIYSPDGYKLTIDAKKTKAFVIDRKKYDEQIAKEAMNNGAEILLSAKVLACERKNKKIKLKYIWNNEIKYLYTNLLVGADGASSIVARSFKFKKPIEYLIGFESEMVNVKDIDKKILEIYVGNKIAPRFFFWIIPIEEDFCRVGLCTDKNPYYYYKLFVKKNKKLIHAKPINYISGIIPIGVLSKPYKDNVMLVGDAGGFVKPMSGGGIYTGLVSSELCAETVIKALNEKNFTENLLSVYKRLLNKKILKEIKYGMKMRKIYCLLSDKNFEKIFSRLDKKEIIEKIETYGDIDYQSIIAKILLKNWRSFLML